MLRDKDTRFMLQGKSDNGDSIKLALFAFFKDKKGVARESAEVRLVLSPSLSGQRRQE
jgi:hypothetical protein